MKIACSYLCDYRDRNDYFLSLMPWGISSIAAYLERENHTVILANLSQHGAIKGAEIILKEKPDAVAVSIFSFNRTESFQLIRELKRKNRNLIIIAGGQHPTFLHEQILSEYPEIDYIVRGEGEAATAKLLGDLKSHERSRVITKERIADLDSLPIPAMFGGKMIGVDPHEQFRYIITTRGCPSKCRYCSSPYFWGRKVTYRSPANIVAELQYIREKYGIIYCSIRDDNFTIDKKRVLEFCRLLGESGTYMMWNCQARVDTVDLEMLVAMKRCGLEHIQFGVESGSEKMLRLYDKATSLERIRRASAAARKAGVYLSFYLMAGMEGEEDADIESTISLMRSALPHDAIVSPVAYYPGTGIYERAKEEGKIDDAIWNRKKDSGLYVMDRKETKGWIKRLLKESSAVSSQAVYNTEDFAAHRKAAGEDCWMTDLLEGDFYLDSGEIERAVATYKRVISRHPENIWGYLKSAEALSEASPAEAIRMFKKAAQKVPSYHGTWLRIAQLEYENGHFDAARKSAEKSLSLDPYDSETVAFLQFLSKRQTKRKRSTN
ncbi:MAG: cobalamin-dependent protein [Deltaproteobacteria bacterium]|nr:cobalamin-dependent protein [Deltaproteobacteria bacterium]